MNKYDFGYEIQKGSTAEWAYNYIEAGKTILEIGPAIGTLAKHLKEDKQCVIDIVEIDSSSGKLAEQFSRNACIGSTEGDIEGDIWFKQYQGNSYDYIVLLDVLEHLRKPEKLLERLYGLLKEDGQVLLSTPNIAHNSVILNLLNNKFEYTEVGILDNTHLKFFTYDSLCKLLHKVGFTIANKNYIQMLVGENEIKNNYSMVPKEVETFLRKRTMADVYQFLFVVKKGGVEDTNDPPSNLSYTGFKFETYLKSKLYTQNFFENSDIEIILNLGEERDENFRIDPIDCDCIISSISIWDVEKGENVKIKATNGGFFQGNKMVFFDEDPQIIIDTTTTGKQLKINCSFEILGSDGIIALQPLWEEQLELKSKYTDIQKQYNVLHNIYEKAESDKEEYFRESEEKGGIIADIQEQYNMLYNIYEKTESDKRECFKQNEEKEKIIATVKKENIILKEQFEQLNGKEEHLQQEILNLRQQSVQLQSELERIKAAKGWKIYERLFGIKKK